MGSTDCFMWNRGEFFMAEQKETVRCSSGCEGKEVAWHLRGTRDG